MAASDTTRLLLQDIEHELQTTRRVLERVPEAKLAWRPHPRSYTLGELATHVARLLTWGPMTIERASVDFATLPKGVGPLATDRADLLAIFDREASEFRQALAGLLAGEAEPALAVRWAVENGGQELIAVPRAVALRRFVVSHVVHHRGQLSVYLRLLDVPLPNMYGPTADEQ
jgi:uncharacterized damage-inducible protein DinB